MDPQQPQVPIPPSQPLVPQQPLAPLPAAPEEKNRVVQQIESANNVLVTVSNNPTVDQLAAAIGTTLILNKLGKHATAVFSGKIPATIEFLQPEKTIEKNTDSLQDFIIALDKAKADKLRYKIEDKFVKIFITPYHTSLSQKDLEFSLGDFNVDVVLALGVMKKEELDQAIIAHGRILHDATVVSINHKPGADIGAINWTEPNSSSLSEIMVGICEQLKPEQKDLIDKQISTAFLTGIVAETDRFSNEKTMPQTMSAAAKLMSAGANQQLISDKLRPPAPPVEKVAVVAPQPAAKPAPSMPKSIQSVQPKTEPAKKPDDGALLVPHETPGVNLDGLETDDDNIDKIHIDDQGQLQRIAEMEANEAKQKRAEKSEEEENARRVISSPPSLGGAMSATAEDGDSQNNVDGLSLPAIKTPILEHNNIGNSDDKKESSDKPLTDEEKERTLADLEKTVHSPHVLEQTQNKPTSLNRLLSEDKGLPPDPTAGSANPGAPPTLPPPMLPPPPSGGDNSTPL